MNETDIQIENLYWEDTKNLRGIKVTHGMLVLACEFIHEDIAVNIATVSAPRNIDEYWQKVNDFWTVQPALYPLFEDWCPKRTLQFPIRNTDVYPFPDWLKNQLEKRWDCEVSARSKELTAEWWCSWGVYVTGAVNTVLTWEQWEQLVQYTEAQR